MRNRLHRKCSNQAWFLWLLRPILWWTDLFWVPYSALWYQRKSDKYALRGYTMITVASKNVLKKAHLSDFFWVPYSALWYQRKSDKYALRGYTMITVASKNEYIKKKAHLSDFFWVPYSALWYQRKSDQYALRGYTMITVASKNVLKKAHLSDFFWVPYSALWYQLFQPSMIFFITSAYILWGTGFTENVPTKHDFFD
jgi:hypothetical protein